MVIREENDMQQLEIKEVCYEKLSEFKRHSSFPRIVNFQNAYVTEQFRGQECSLLADKFNEKRTLLTELDNILYVGEEQNEELGRTLLIARSKSTNKVRIIEVASTIDVKPVIKNSLDVTQVLDTSNLELSRKFGSKKEKKRVEQRERLKTNVETIKKQVETATADISQDQIDLSSYTEATSQDDFYVPPIDRTATSLEGIYDVDKILTEDQYETITSEIDGKDYISEMTPWVRSLVETSSMKHQILGLYASCLIKFYSLTVKDINKKDFSACNSSQTIHKLIYEGFTSGTGNRRSRPINYKDKALCHTAVFLLLVNKYKIPVTNFCEAFAVTPATVMQKLRVTGATMATQDGKKMLQLKYPLNFKPVFRRKSAKF